MVIFGSCGQQYIPEQIEAATVVVEPEGSVLYYVTESFEKSYYDIAELRTMAEHEVSAFNADRAMSGSVILDKVAWNESGEKVIVGYRFPDDSTFREFAGVFLEYDTIDRAILTGYLKEGLTLTGNKGEVTTDQDFFLKHRKRHVVVVDPGVTVYCPSDVLYCSEGVSIREDGGAAVPETEEGKKRIIILKK